MQVTLELPEDLALLLGSEPAALSRAVLESVALEGLRSERLSVGQARRLLGIESIDEMDDFLKLHGVWLPSTLAEIRQDAATATAASRLK